MARALQHHASIEMMLLLSAVIVISLAGTVAAFTATMSPASASTRIAWVAGAHHIRPSRGNKNECRSIHTQWAKSDGAETDGGSSAGAAVASSSSALPTVSSSLDPQIMSCGFSQNMDLVTALQQAVAMAMENVPAKTIHLAFVTVSSLYDGTASPSAVVPAILAAIRSFGVDVEHLIGCTNGGYISSSQRENVSGLTNDLGQTIAFGDDGDQNDNDNNKERKALSQACKPTDQEGIPGVSVVLCVFPNVQIKTFHVSGANMPEDARSKSSQEWKSVIGLNGFNKDPNGNSAVFLLPSPAFQPDIDVLLDGVSKSLGKENDVTMFGGAASTVSSLSRARLFRHDSQDPGCVNTLADGCVGVAMTGDIRVETILAQGAKPVGGVYQIIKGSDSTIQAIALDESATELAKSEEDDDQDDEIDDLAAATASAVQDKKAIVAAAYAKARIPKPPLAEANFIMRTLSDDDRSFMSKVILVGIEVQKGISMRHASSELEHLAQGKGYRYEVHQVASAGVKDGSVTMSLNTVKVEPGMRLRFFVRSNEFAKREVEALWKGYKCQVAKDGLASRRTPTGCFMFPTLDRGSKFFMGKPGYESNYASQYLPSLPCINGFFSNGVIGKLQMNGSDLSKFDRTRLRGSGTGYVLLSSKSQRPFYLAATETEKQGIEEAESKNIGASESTSRSDLGVKAPRDERGELILKRREVHSGRALTVSTVEWSVAEKTALPTSTLEGFMWDKETEVDRFRERVPLANLVSQCRQASVDPLKHKSRDWIGPVKEAAAAGRFVIVPECKRVDPVSGSLRKRYDLNKIVREYALAGVPAMSVNCDAVLFGGSLEDVSKAREVLSAATVSGETGPPILASDLLLYPYQLYKISLAGADAVNLVVGALAAKDLIYLSKIAASLKLQTLVTVTSTAQIETLDVLPTDSINGVIVSNRKLEDYSFDMTGQQALDILRSDVLRKFKEKHGADFPILVEGRVGLIERQGSGSKLNYLEELQQAGAIGAIVGGGLVKTDLNGLSSPLEALMGATRL